MDWVHDEVHGLGPQRWSTFCIRPFVCKKKGPKGLTDGFRGGEKSKKKTYWFCGSFIFGWQCIYSILKGYKISSKVGMWKGYLVPKMVYQRVRVGKGLDLRAEPSCMKFCWESKSSVTHSQPLSLTGNTNVWFTECKYTVFLHFESLLLWSETHNSF